MSEGDELFHLLSTRREALIERWSLRVKSVTDAGALTQAEFLDHIPLFVEELIRALYPDAAPLPPPAFNALEHGGQRLQLGFNVGEVIREYGMLHTCIIELAQESDVIISLRDQTVIAAWLNAGIANAVSQYMSLRDVELQRKESEHLGFIAHELRSPLSAALMAFERLRRSELAAGGRPVELLERNLRRTGDIIDNALTLASLKMGVAPRLEPIDLPRFLLDIEQDAGVEAQGKGIAIAVKVEPGLTLIGDVRLLHSAVANLMHNALKFSKPNATIHVEAHSSEGRFLVDVSDGCGGLPPGRAEELFTPLVQRDQNRSGFGLGLAIALQAAEAHNGTIKVRDKPGVGCVFTIDLPASVRGEPRQLT